MRFFEVVISGAALISAVFAVEFNDVPKSFEPGKTYTITYSPKDNTPTTIKLRQGDPNNLATLATITTTATGGSFQYTVPRDLPNSPSYALEISQANSPPNYTGLIPLTGSTYSAVSSSSTSKPSSSASSSAASSSSVSASTTSSSASSTLTTKTTSAAGSASGVPTPSSGSNSTIASSSRTPTASSGSPSATGGSSPPQQTQNAASLLASSPVALILGAVAAMAYL